MLFKICVAFMSVLLSSGYVTVDAKPHAPIKKQIKGKKSSKKAPAKSTQKSSKPTKTTPKPSVKKNYMTSYGVDVMSDYAILVDFETGRVLLEKNADKPMAPSSMTKILSACVVFDKLKKGVLSEDDIFTVGKNAFRLEGSTSFLKLNENVSVMELLRGLIVQSGNDAAVTLAEGISGTEADFAEEMNNLAFSMGAKNTHFVNASGLPHDNHKTTARDLSIIARRSIIDYPKYYGLWGEKEFTHNNITQMNRNPLLYKNFGCDGIKTGSTAAAGFSVVASCVKNGRRLILVINGLKTMQARADEAYTLMDWGFQNFKNYKIFAKNHKFATIPVWYGDKNHVDVIIPHDVVLTLKRMNPKSISYTFDHQKSLSGAQKSGTVVGTVTVSSPKFDAPYQFPLTIDGEIKPAGFFKRMWDHGVKLFNGR